MTRVIAVVVCAVLASACSNPKCWTHDPSEVQGGCHVFSGSSRSRPKPAPEPEPPDHHARLLENEGPCAVGKPYACGIVADAKEAMKRAPAEEIEANYTTACLGDQRVVPSAPVHWCRKAGDYALQRRDEAIAIERFKLGCTLHDKFACVRAARVDRTHADEHLIAACRLDHHESCVTVVKRHADPANREHREIMMLGCKHRIDDACALLGKLAATDGEVAEATSCKQDDRNACISIGRDAVNRPAR